MGDELLGGWLDGKLDERDLLDELLAPPLAELKPPALPPFTGYTGHLSINGIPGHHYHAIAQRLPEENNNYPPPYQDQNVVSSSTCGGDAELDDVKPFAPLDQPHLPPSGNSAPGHAAPKAETYDISTIDEFAAIIGSAIADTTVPSQPEDPERSASRDSWMDLDLWIANSSFGERDELAEFGLTRSPEPAARSTLHSLLTHGYLPAGGRAPARQEAHSTHDELVTTSLFAPPTHKPRRSRGKQKPPPGPPYAAELALLGKEKPVHRCGICNRGFLNKSNIKVHLRTHTGEKPFRCDVCAKAFRQKAHLIKHQQIHKRIGRD